MPCMMVCDQIDATSEERFVGTWPHLCDLCKHKPNELIWKIDGIMISPAFLWTNASQDNQ